MRRFATRRFASAVAALSLWSLPALANEGPATALDYRAKTDGLSGLSLFFVNLYNDRRLAFAAVCTVMMAGCGIIIAFTVDRLLQSLGLTVTKQGHRE